MKYTTTICIADSSQADNIIKLFEPEEKEFSNKRASYTIAKTTDGIEFSIQANDATALRAVLNSISKNLIIYEKAQNGPENSR